MMEFSRGRNWCHIPPIEFQTLESMPRFIEAVLVALLRHFVGISFYFDSYLPVSEGGYCMGTVERTIDIVVHDRADSSMCCLELQQPL